VEKFGSGYDSDINHHSERRTLHPATTDNAQKPLYRRYTIGMATIDPIAYEIYTGKRISVRKKWGAMARENLTRKIQRGT